MRKKREYVVCAIGNADTKHAIIQKAKNEAISEEMRILYVAMTRAQDILILSKDIVYSERSSKKSKCEKLKSDIDTLNKLLGEIEEFKEKKINKRTIKRISRKSPKDI